MNIPNILERSTLNAHERLKLRKQIETLFQNGKAFSVPALRVVYSLVPRAPEEISPVRVAFSIPKKRVRKATARNKVRRRLKEAWRLQKQSIYRELPAEQQLHLFVVYQGREPFRFEQAQAATTKFIQELLKRLNASAT